MQKKKMKKKLCFNNKKKKRNIPVKIFNKVLYIILKLRDN